MDYQIISLNAHSFVSLDPSTPVELANVKGREVFIFKGEDLTPYVLFKVEPSGLPVPKVSRSSESKETSFSFNGVEVSLTVSAGGLPQIENLPPEKEGVLYLSSSLTSQAALDMGRKDIIAPRQLVYQMKEDASTLVLGAIGFKVGG